MTAVGNLVSRDRISALLTTLPFRVFAFALVITFVEPLKRGMPIGLTRQLGQLVPETVLSIVRSTTNLAYMATFGLAGLWMLWSWRDLRRSRLVFVAALLIGLGVIVGATTGLLGESPPLHALAHGQFVIPYVIALGLPLTTRLEWTRLLLALRIGFTVPAMYSLFLLIANGGSQPIWYSRIIPNGISFSGVACMLWLAYARVSNRRWPYAFAALCGGGVFVSGARGWIAALVLGLMVYVVVSRRGRPPTRPLYMFLSGFACSIGVGVLLGLGMLDSLITRTTRGTGSLRDRRIEQAEKLFNEFTDSPFFGSGLGYRNPDLARRVDWIYEGPRPYLAELSYPNLLAKMGLVGFGLLAAGIIVALVVLHRHAKQTAPDPTASALFAGAIYLLLSSLLNPTFESVFLHTFIALALFGTLGFVERDLDRPESVPVEDPSDLSPAVQ